MKTVEGAYLGLDESMQPTGTTEERDLGRLHEDAAVSHLMGMPRSISGELDPSLLPRLRLKGRGDVFLTLARSAKAEEFLLTVTGGETDLPVADIQATYRVRAFVEYWGEETELTEEIRLSPEAREALANQEHQLDARREECLQSAAPRTIFRQRPRLRPALLIAFGGIAFGLSALVSPGPAAATGAVALALILLGGVLGILSLLGRQELEVDRDAGVLREGRGNRRSDLHRLSEVEQSDVDPKPGGRAHVLVRLGDDRGTRVLGSSLWPVDQAERIAEAVNDAVRLPESQRKLLQYRRAARERGEPDR
jgi:hypothetical protein